MKIIASVAYLGVLSATAAAQTPPSAPAPAVIVGTKLEAFRPAVGGVVTMGAEDVGEVAGITVGVREMRDAKTGVVRGLAITVADGPSRREVVYIDADEIPEVLAGVDALLKVSTNPTTYKNFEVRYVSRGDLQLAAINQAENTVGFVLRPRKDHPGQALTARQLTRLRELIIAGQSRIVVETKS